jgi:signal transduction histidine kinase
MPATILVVEDEPNIGALVCTYLRREGHDVLWVRRGEDALVELRRHAIKLVLLDVRLPGIDGCVVEQSVQRHLPRARDMGVELSGAATAETWVLGDHDRILQAVSNLIENALRITPAGGSVSVAAAPDQITVRDTGPGLDPEDIPRAFERFYLYGRYRSERPVGSGLGLAIVRELVAAMGGTVEASTPPGGGAEFTIRLASIPARSALPDAVQPSA